MKDLEPPRCDPLCAIDYLLRHRLLHDRSAVHEVNGSRLEMTVRSTYQYATGGIGLSTVTGKVVTNFQCAGRGWYLGAV